MTVAILCTLCALCALVLLLSTMNGFRAERRLLGYDAEWEELKKKAGEQNAPRPTHTREDRHTENDPSVL